MTYGLTDTGFVKKTLEVIKQELKEEQLDAISAELNLLETSLFGQINGIVGDKLRELWDLALAVYRAGFPDSASGEALDQIASITGATRLDATPSTVTLDQLFLEDTVTVPAGSVVSVGSTGARFVTLEDVTNSTGYNATLSVDAESEDTGPIAGYAGTIDTIQTAVSGWSDKPAVTAANSETYTLDDLYLEVQVDEGEIQNVNFNAGNPWSSEDVKAAIVGQTTGIEGWDINGKPRIGTTTSGGSIKVVGGTANAQIGFPTALIKGFNSEDATPGTNIEEDPAFRTRREQLLRVVGAGTVEAIRAAVVALDVVEQAVVFENVTLVTDGDGLPGKSFEVIAQGPSQDDEYQEVCEKIWEVKPAGIEAHGDISKTVTDSQDIEHTIKMSVPTPVPIYIECEIDVDSDLFPADGLSQVETALKAYGDTLEVGESVYAIQFKCVPLNVAGVLDVTVFKIDDVDPPVGTGNIVLTKRELATFDVDDIDVSLKV